MTVHPTTPNRQTLANAKIGVLGMGVSGQAMVRYLTTAGARVYWADSRVEPPAKAAELFADVTKVFVGSFPEALFTTVDALALSPGIDPRSLPKSASKLPWWSEVTLFATALATTAPEAKVFAITGTNGKSTTCALTAHILRLCGIKTALAGNIGPSLLDVWRDEQALPPAHRATVWVIELSSFQLEQTTAFRHHHAAILNIAEDHLERYADLDDYVHTKLRITQGADYVVVNRDDPALACVEAQATFGLSATNQHDKDWYFDGQDFYQGRQLLGRFANFVLTGQHNASNVMAALALVATVQPNSAQALAAAQSFTPLAHRMALVRTLDGVRYINDSKSTTVMSTLAALTGMTGRCHLILGGKGKNQDFTPLAKVIAEHCASVLLLGEDAPVIARALAPSTEQTQLKQFTTLPNAIAWAHGQALPGDVVLLSPACASFDMFASFAKRGEVFSQVVHALAPAAKQVHHG